MEKYALQLPEYFPLNAFISMCEGIKPIGALFEQVQNSLEVSSYEIIMWEQWP